MGDRRRGGRDRLAGCLGWSVVGLVTLVLGWILSDIVRAGWRRVSWEFLTAAPSDAGRGGGIGTLLVSNGLILAVCLVVAVPLGIGCAVYLTEFTRREGWVGWLLRQSLALLAAVPSIVFGLFGAVFFGQLLGLGFSLITGGLTLACMVLPILIRATEAGLRSVPDELRWGAAALGMTQTATIRYLLVPAAVPGVMVGLVLGIGRALAETAALIFTAGYVTRMPSSLFDSGRSLSVHIYDLAMNVPGGDESAYATALVLVVLVLVVNGIAAWATERWLVGAWLR